MELKYKYVAILIFIAHIVTAQPKFINKTTQYKNQLSTRSVMPGAALDMDGDLVDDLIILDKGNTLKLVKSNGKHFGLALLDSIKTTSVREWTMAGGDINNDGSVELILAGEYNLGSIVSTNSTKLSKKSFVSGIYAQGSNTVDINNDGWLDYYVCNDDGPNNIYINDKSGNLILTDIIDFTLNDPTDGSGNYGSEWIDVNGDMLPDLCISKCRAGVEDPNDQRRINRLYINKGNGTFAEEGASFGLNSGQQSWVTAFGDIDNDGDQDAFVVNHYGPHELLENINGQTFQTIEMPNTFSSFSFQAIMRDFDNDGWLDILLTGVEGSILMQNNRDKTFTIIRDIIGPSQPRSMSCGDFNDDGFLDVHAHLGEPINDVGLTDDQLWLNETNQNHYVKFNLEGSASNKSAVGAHLTLFGTWGKQVRYIKGGESYGIFNSLQQIFGIGLAEMVDSLVVTWPSGTIDKYTNLLADNTYLLQEGKCISSQVELYDEVLVVRDTNIMMNALPNFQTYLWNNGKSNHSIQEGPGTYHVTMTDVNGCKTISKPIVVISGCFEADVKLFTIPKDIKQCAGSEIEIFATQAAEYIWHDGTTTSNYVANETGWVTLSASDYCGRTVRDSVFITFVNIDWSAKGDTVTIGKSATLTSSHPNTQWFEFPDYINPIFIGDTLITPALDMTKNYKAKAIQIIDKKIANVGENTYPSSNFYGANTIAGNMVFNVERKCILHSVNVNTDTEGLRRIIITNFFDEIILSKDIYLEAGITKIVLDALLEPGFNYRISTDESVNQSSFGFKSPRLVRTFNNTSYPYRIENVLSILSSSFGAPYYMYFYDWEVHHDITTCESELVDVVAFVDKENATFDIDVKELATIYPNPTSDKLYIHLDKKVSRANILNLSHQSIEENIKSNTTIDVSAWPSGMYILSLMVDDKLYHIKWIKQR